MVCATTSFDVMVQRSATDVNDVVRQPSVEPTNSTEPTKIDVADHLTAIF